MNRELKTECDNLRYDCTQYNLYQSSTAKDILRTLSQEANWTSCLTQLGHSSKEYAKGMKSLLEHCLNLIEHKNEEWDAAEESIKKLTKSLKTKELALDDLEEEIEMVHQKESQLNRKREEIFR